MKLIDQSEMMSTIVDRWKQCYKDIFNEYPDKKVIYNRLKNLPDNATSLDIDTVIGNGTWTTMFCDECNNHRPVVILFTNNFHICIECIEKSLSLVRMTVES